MSTATTGLRALHQELGARFAADGAGGAPRNYGNPAAEYRAAREACVVVDRSDRAVWRASGRDPVRMLQGLVTNDLAGAAEGRGVYAALLTPKGRMVAELRLFRLAEREVLFDTAAGAQEELSATLRKYVPPLFARIEPMEMAVLGVYGPHARDTIVAALGVEVPAEQPPEGWVTAEPAQHAEQGPTLVVRTPYVGVAGYDVLLPAGRAAAAFRALLAAGAAPAGHATLEVLRIEAGTPRWGAELTGDVIPLEAGLRERAISETKGCYTGQEVIIRILHRGHVNWRLRGLLMGEAPAPVAGARLTRPGEEKAVARVTSACSSPALGQTVALAYARRELEPGARLERPGGGQAELVELPFRA
ncbi:MAG TPA: glycine cleavage T C-terminal barrel domain-containing protein [Longimicrobiales bacterium]|nr:glycine cleavage T C-terminal barrel domain-containing protein [Longimicrobiales bacterium]